MSDAYDCLALWADALFYNVSAWRVLITALVLGGYVDRRLVAARQDRRQEKTQLISSIASHQADANGVKIERVAAAVERTEAKVDDAKKVLDEKAAARGRPAPAARP